MTTEIRLKEWRYGQVQSERLCAGLLLIDGYRDVDPQAPLGGADNKKDILAKRDGKLFVVAAYFPTMQRPFTDIKSKFIADREGVRTNDADGFVFFVNQHLSLGERDKLRELGSASDQIYHLERILNLLDSPVGYGLREEYLRIPVPATELFNTIEVNRKYKIASSCDPIHLGVSKAITVTTPGDLAPLPLYVERSHDRQLRCLLSKVDAATRCVVVTGGSSSGKTRAMWEAAQAHLGDWKLIRPQTAAGLVRDVRQGIKPRSILWLDELHDYLLDSSNGAQAAESLLSLYEVSGPIVILGSMWSRHWSKLTARPFSGDNHLRLVRNLLLNHTEEVLVPEVFSSDPAALRELNQLKAKDPRLALAFDTAGPDMAVTQVLSGGAQLVQAYERGVSAQGTAIISVAMDARRIGVPGPYSATLLKDAAADYLPYSRRIGRLDWFNEALDYATEVVQGIAALAPVRISSDVSAAEGYVLHDYLAQHGELTRQHCRIPDSFWRSFSQLDDAMTLLLLGRAAQSRLLYEYAESYLKKATAAGNANARMQLATLYASQGRTTERDEQLHLAGTTQPYAHVERARDFRVKV